jgi:transcriptional regulator with XRE-family HTH domain
MKPPRKLRAAALPPSTSTFLRAWRESRGMTQTALADAAGTTAATISRIESGKTGYSQELIERVAAVLNIGTSELLFMDPQDPAAFFRKLLRSSEAARAGLVQALAEGISGFEAASDPDKRGYAA